MKSTQSRKTKQRQKKAFYVANFGRQKVPVYRRKTPSGNHTFMVANYSEVGEDGKPKRRFDCYGDEDSAKEAAENLAEHPSKREVVAATITNQQAIEFASAQEVLKPLNVSVAAAACAVAECLKLVGDLANLHAASRFYVARHKQTVKKSVAEVVAELLKVKGARGASERYGPFARSLSAAASWGFTCSPPTASSPCLANRTPAESGASSRT